MTSVRHSAHLRLGTPFWRLCTATAVSSLGDGAVMVGFPLLALTLTHSPVLIAGVAIAGRLPALLWSLPAGALADRVDRRRLILATTVVRAVALAAFAAVLLVGADDLFAVYATVFVLGTGEMVFDIATQASLPGLVGPDGLSRANGHLAAAEVSSEQFIGPALGGLVFAAAAALPFAADAVSFGVSAVLLRRSVPGTLAAELPDTVSSAQGAARAGGPETTLRRDVAEGMRWFLGHPLLRLLALVVASLAFCQAMALSLLVLYGTGQLHLGRAGYGVFLAVAAVGNVVGALSAGRLHRRLGTASCVIAAACAAGLSYLALAMTDSIPLAVGALVLEGLAVAVGNVTTLSLRQRIIPPALLGRVGSAFRLLIYGLIPVGALSGGLICTQFGIRSALEIAGWVQLGVLALAAPALVRRIRDVEGDQRDRAGHPVGRGPGAASTSGQPIG